MSAKPVGLCHQARQPPHLRDLGADGDIKALPERRVQWCAKERSGVGGDEDRPRAAALRLCEGAVDVRRAHAGGDARKITLFPKGLIRIHESKGG